MPSAFVEPHTLQNATSKPHLPTGTHEPPCQLLSLLQVKPLSLKQSEGKDPKASCGSKPITVGNDMPRARTNLSHESFPRRLAWV